MNKNLLIIIFGLSGMAALIYEIVWIRPLTLVFGSSVYAVSTIISSFILGLAIGSWLAGKYSDKIKNHLKYFAMFQIGIGIYGLLLLPVFASLPGVYLEVYHLTFPNQYFFQFTQILMAMLLISVPATMMGTTLPLMVRTYSKNFTTIGSDVGRLDAANSIGAVFGTLAAGFVMLPLLGIQDSIIITAMINFGIGIIILAKRHYVKYQYLIGIIILIVVIFWFVPGYDPESLNFGTYTYAHPGFSNEDRSKFLSVLDLVFYKDSLYSTVMVTGTPDKKYLLTINGKIQCSNIEQSEKEIIRLSSFAYDVFRNNYGEPDNALVVGLGCGANSKWFSDRLHTTTVEIDPAVVDASKIFYPKIKHDLFIDDARNWLLRNDVKFDIIMGQPQDPYENYGNLYTQEYFELLKSRLTDKGIVSQWGPLFEMSQSDLHIFYNTFHSVFPYVYIFQTNEGDIPQSLVLLGSMKPLEIDEQVYYLASHETFKPERTIINTDNHNTLEYTSALNLYQKYTKGFANATFG
ncbi:MAG: spermidine synthase [Nitrosopumilaceae archaeon]